MADLSWLDSDDDDDQKDKNDGDNIDDNDDIKQVSCNEKKPFFTKKIEKVSQEYLIESKLIQRRKSLIITNTGKLRCIAWDNQLHKKGGVIRIQCTKEIMIEKDGIISAFGTGWFDKYGIGNGQKLRHYDVFGGASYGANKGGKFYDNHTKSSLLPGTTYGDKLVNKELYFGSGNKYLRGGGIIELVAPLITNNGQINCCGHGGCSGGTIFICCDKFVNYGSVIGKGGNKTSFCGKGGDGRIAIYCNTFEDHGLIEPDPYIHKMNKKAKKKKTVYEQGMEYVKSRPKLKFNIVCDQKYNISSVDNRGDEKKSDERIKNEKDVTKCVKKMVDFLLKCEDKITDTKDFYTKMGVNAEIQKLLATKLGYDVMYKNRKLYQYTKFRSHSVIDRLVLELKFVKLLISDDFIEFSMQYRASKNIFESNSFATMMYNNGRNEPFDSILPRVRFRLLYQYLDPKTMKIKKQNSDFKFREKSLETKSCVWDFGGKKIHKYEILIKVDRTNDKYVSALKNNLFNVQRSVNVANGFQIETEELQRCGFLRIERKSKLFVKPWYSSSKSGGKIAIDCYDVVIFGSIDVTTKGQYGKYGKGAGKLKKSKKKKKKKSKNKKKGEDDYYFGATFDHGNPTLDVPYFGSGLVGRKYLKGGGIIDLNVKDHCINYGMILSNGSLSSAGGCIFICCKIFVNYGDIQAKGGKEIEEKSGKGSDGRIAIYAKVFENFGTITPEPHIGTWEEGKVLFQKGMERKQKKQNNFV